MVINFVDYENGVFCFLAAESFKRKNLNMNLSKGEK